MSPSNRCRIWRAHRGARAHRRLPLRVRDGLGRRRGEVGHRLRLRTIHVRAPDFDDVGAHRLRHRTDDVAAGGLVAGGGSLVWGPHCLLLVSAVAVSNALGMLALVAGMITFDIGMGCAVVAGLVAARWDTGRYWRRCRVSPHSDASAMPS